MYRNNLEEQSCRLSFTFGGLLVPESQVLAEQYLRLKDWEKTRNHIEAKNMLQKGKLSTGRRYFRELRQRLMLADPWELDIISREHPDMIRPVLFLLFCRYYRFLKDVAIELVSWKYQGKDFGLEKYELAALWERKAEVHHEMTRVSDSTREKLLSVSLRVLQEAGFLLPVKNNAGGMRIVKPPVPELVLAYYRGKEDQEALRLLLH